MDRVIVTKFDSRFCQFAVDFLVGAVDVESGLVDGELDMDQGLVLAFSVSRWVGWWRL